MNAYLRPFRRDIDIAAMIELATASPADAQHVVDLPFRLCSWALDDPRNVGLWTDERGRLVAWAVMQYPFWTIDLVIHPDAKASVSPAVLKWAISHARRAKGTPNERSSWYVHVFADQENRLRDLEAAGFACQSDVGEDSWSKVFLQRKGPIPSLARLAPGLAIRPLAGLAEVEAYVDVHRAAFGSANMTVEWRTRTLAAPHYLADADLVAVADDGNLIGFCIGWLLQGERPIGRIEPLGVAPEFREHGIGAALIRECLGRLTEQGADRVVVETDTFRDPALQLYESAGFKRIRDILVFRKDFTDRLTE